MSVMHTMEQMNNASPTYYSAKPGPVQENLGPGENFIWGLLNDTLIK